MSLCWGDKAWTIVLQMTYHFSNSVSCTNKSADSGKHIKSFPVAFSIISQRLVYQCFNSFLLHIHLLYRVSLMRILSTSFILVITRTMKEPDWNTENSTDSSMPKNHSLGSCWFCLFCLSSSKQKCRSAFQWECECLSADTNLPHLQRWPRVPAFSRLQPTTWASPRGRTSASPAAPHGWWTPGNRLVNVALQLINHPAGKEQIYCSSPL